MYRMGDPAELRDAIGRTGNTTVLDYEIPTASGRRDENIYNTLSLSETMTSSSNIGYNPSKSAYGVSKPKADAWALRKVQIFCVILLTMLVISSVTIGVLIHTLMQRMNATEAKSDELQAKINKLQDSSGPLTENDPISIEDMQIRLLEIESKIEAQKEDTNADFQVHSSKISQLERDSSFHTSLIQDHGSRITQLESKEALNDNDIQELDIRVQSLETEGSTDQAFSQKLNNTLTQLTMNISANGEEVQKLHTRLNEIESGKILEQENGVTYVRWGRSVCPADSEKVYTGYVGGGHYTHSGSGANWLCLTDEPQYGYHEDNTDTGALVYGGEYEFGGQKNGGSGFFGQNLNDLDALCVVCRPPRPSVVMIPGRNTCYGGWRMEYSGYLVGGHRTHSASNFICLDSRPEPRKGSHTDRNGKLFYMAAGICGALPCPPYVNGRQLTCVVCSK